jgi:hypothetical protein
MDAIRPDLLAQVVQREGKVLILFSRRSEATGELVSERTDHYMVDPEGALTMAECLSTMAFEADTGLKPVGETLKAELVKKHREKLTPRVALMLNTLRENKRFNNQQITNQLLDAFFSEVFS